MEKKFNLKQSREEVLDELYLSFGDFLLENRKTYLISILRDLLEKRDDEFIKVLDDLVISYVGIPHILREKLKEIQGGGRNSSQP
jgi:hypothetical protein